MTNIIAACVTLVWLAATGPVAYYDVYKDGTFFTTVYEESVEMCRDGYNWPHYITVIAFNADNEQGPESDHLEMQWVWDFNYDDDGIVGFLDYFIFAKDYGTTAERSNADEKGTVSFGDFIIFARAFGKCRSPNGMLEVDCG